MPAHATTAASFRLTGLRRFTRRRRCGMATSPIPQTSLVRTTEASTATIIPIESATRAAFANARGGGLVIGVTERNKKALARRPLQADGHEASEQWIGQALRNHVTVEVQDP